MSIAVDAIPVSDERGFWGLTLVLACTIAVATNVAAILTLLSPLAASVGFDWWPSGRPYEVRVVNIDAHGPAASSGLRVGDTFDIRSPQGAFQAFWAARVGKPASFVVDRAGTHVQVTIVPRRSPWLTSSTVHFIAAFWTIAIAAMIGWRRRDDRSARLLALYLLVLASAGGLYRMQTPDLMTGVIAFSAASLSAALSVSMFLYFLSSFGLPLSPVRRLFFAAAIAIVLLYCAQAIVLNVDYLTLAFNPFGATFSAAVTSAMQAFALILVVICGLLTVGAAKEIERQRVAWIVGTIGLVYSAWAANDIVQVAVSNPQALRLLGDIENVSLFILPVGLAYATIRHRIFDIGFVVNRVIVYGLLSAIVVGTFIALDFLLGLLVNRVSPETSLIAQLVLALVLGYTTNFLHRFVDRFVDRVFFAKRRRDERALRRFAHEAESFTSERALLDNACNVLTDHSEATAVGIYLYGETAVRRERQSIKEVPEALDLNDPAIVSLRRWHEPVDTHDMRTELGEGMLFPILAHHKLLGAVFCGTKRDGSSYSPDERELMGEVSHAVARALHVLASRGEQEDLRSRLDRIERLVLQTQS